MLNDECQFIIESHLGHGHAHDFAYDLIGEINYRHEKGDDFMTHHKVNVYVQTLPSTGRQTLDHCGRDRGVNKAAGCSSQTFQGGNVLV